MTEVAGIYFDGQTSQPRPVTLRFNDDGSLVIVGQGLERSFRRDEVRVESRLGRAPRFVRLPDDARCEVRDNDGIDRALSHWRGQRAARWLHRLEASWRLAALGVIVMGLLTFLAVRFGLPLAAGYIAARLPATISARIGADALAALDEILFEPSQLPAERREELEARFAGFLARQGGNTDYTLVFRASPKIGANAFALPDGTIVMTDELVALAEHDDEILGVLAHECGHVQRRHALRSILQHSALVVVITLATGDMSTVSAVGTMLPTLLLEAKYSRLFETEADAYGVAAMRAAGLDPVHLANILERLSGDVGEAGEVLAYISSHPATRERIRAITGEPAEP